MKIEERLLTISTLGAQSNLWHKGFRQRDVRFLAQLFTNWMDTLLQPEIPVWHNTQIMRYLNEATKHGLIKASGSGRERTYRLTRMGLLELVHRMVDIQGYSEMRHTLLVYYFLAAYKNRMIHLIAKEGSGFSKAVQLEIEHLLDSKHFLNQQLRLLKQQIDRMRVRVEESRAAAALAEKMNRQQENLSHIIEKVATLHPYEFEVQKPMSELFKEIEPEQRLWELIQGNRHRAEILWQTQLEVLVRHHEILQSLERRV